MTAPNFESQPGEFVPLPPGYGRQIRRRTIIGALMQIIVGVAVAAMALFIAQWQQIPDLHGWVDPLWRLNIAVGWVPAVVTIGAAINALRVPVAIKGDSLRQPDVHRLVRGCRVWWIVSMASAVLVAATLLIGCIVVFREPGSDFAASDAFQFFVPLVTLSFGSILYLNVRFMLLRWPADLLRTWRAGRLPR